MVQIREKLHTIPILGMIVIIILFLIFDNVPTYLLLLIQSEVEYLTFLFLKFIVRFSTIGILALIIIPRILHLPKGNESIKEVSHTIKLDTVHPYKRNLVIGIGVTILSCLSALIGSLLTFKYTFDPTILFNTPGTHPGNGLGWFRIIEMLYPGIWEEVVFRGLIITLLLKKYPDKNAAIISSLAFGLAHFHNLIGAELTAYNVLFTCAQVVNAASLGYVLAYIYLKTESLFPGIIFHYLYDVLFLFVGNIPIAEINFLYGSLLLITFITIVPLVINVKFTNYIFKREKVLKKDNNLI